MIDSCSQITVGESLTQWQIKGLEIVSWFRGRDVVFAIDLTESVSLDDEGRLRLRQIIDDSLKSGDTVYIVPFSSEVNPGNDNNSLTPPEAIKVRNRQESIEAILNRIPLQADLNESNTDIQKAEHFIYQNLAQINQNRLCETEAIKHQSVVWLTDAPLKTDPGITSDVWIETPANSPYRDATTTESINRQNWLDNLPLTSNSRTIGNYQLTVVDIAPTVQEFCTPAPGGQQTCLVNPYLFNQLWLPFTVVFLSFLGVMGASFYSIKYYLALKNVWKLEILLDNDEYNSQIIYLKNNQSLSIGEEIQCAGGETRGYLKRKGTQLIIQPQPHGLPLEYRHRQITEKIVLPIKQNRSIFLNLPDEKQDLSINIKISN
ncbi:MAG: VWA domain-containing protein [Cyanobacterium sp.]